MYTIFEHRPRPASIVTGLTPINFLPDAILLDVFELDWFGHSFPPDSCWRPDSEKSTTRRIVRVCKRWYTICQPLLYRRINLSIGTGTRLNKSCYKLHRTLENRPDLRTVTREVHILVDGMYNAAFSVSNADNVTQMLRWWRPSLRKASIHGCIEAPESRPILFKLSQIALDDLRLGGYHHGMSISFFLKYFQSPFLKVLNLGRPTWSDDRDVAGQHASTWGHGVGTVRSDEQVHLPKDRQCTSDLKHLYLSDPYVAPRALEILLKWPRALEGISMMYLMHSPCAEQYTATAVERLLALQAHSLRTVKIGHMSNRNRGIMHASNIPDFANLCELKHLTLSYWNVFHTPPSTAYWKLAAPKLKCFVIDFSTEDQHDQDSNACDASVRDWLVELAELWQLWNGHCSLEQIKIDHDSWPDIYDTCMEPDSVPWTDQYVHTARKQMSKHGIRLAFPGQDMDEQSWRDRMRDLVAKYNEADEEETTKGEIEARDAPLETEDTSENLHQQLHDPLQQRLCRIFCSTMQCIH